MKRLLLAFVLSLALVGTAGAGQIGPAVPADAEQVSGGPLGECQGNVVLMYSYKRTDGGATVIVKLPNKEPRITVHYKTGPEDPNMETLEVWDGKELVASWEALKERLHGDLCEAFARME